LTTVTPQEQCIFQRYDSRNPPDTSGWWKKKIIVCTQCTGSRMLA